MAPGTSIAAICRARTLRHREETRNDFREISDAIRRSAEPLSANDARRPFMIPLDHDPYDVWHQILSKIVDPKEVTKLWEVCSLFREILSSRQKYVQTRLPQIVQLIKDKRPEFLLDSDAGPGNGRVPAWRIANQWKSTLLDLRLISRQCRYSVEEVLLKRACFRHKKFYLILRTAAQVKAIIDDTEGKENLIDSFQPPNLEISEEVDLENQERELFWENLVSLLKLIGKRVNTLKYYSMDTIQGTHEKLSELVLYMPNLETLELWQGIQFDFTLVRIHRNPTVLADPPAFPNCPQLRSFIQGWKILPKAYFQRVLEANPQIKVVSASRLSANEELLVLPQLKSTLQNLECLHIPLHAPLFRHLEFQLPLKEIIFHGIGFHISWTFFPIDIFPFLHQFRDTLERLELDVVVERTGTHSLDLPNLKFFKWEYGSSFQDLLFLLPAWRLEELQVVLVGHYPNFKAFSDCFFKKVTNGFDGLTLWEVFPRCKRVLIEFPFSLEKSTEICRP